MAKRKTVNKNLTSVERYNFKTNNGVQMFCEGSDAQRVVNSINEASPKALDVIAKCLKFCSEQNDLFPSGLSHKLPFFKVGN